MSVTTGFVWRAGLVGGVLLGVAGVGMAQDGVKANHSVIESDGTAVVTRVVPVPTTISPEAQRMLGRVVSDKAVPQSLAERRAGTDTWQNGAGEGFRKA